ncbi:regulator of chromosome condensation 1/beta-lactamase-inhibitor protein II [Phellopilus nigrolimitatus]|nr:regulator of chromosome condensation 1/beta-lactamase-inhibitor protein II [Phellopilus nigrolimitatus]
MSIFKLRLRLDLSTSWLRSAGSFSFFVPSPCRSQQQQQQQQQQLVLIPSRWSILYWLTHALGGIRGKFGQIKDLAPERMPLSPRSHVCLCPPDYAPRFSDRLKTSDSARLTAKTKSHGKEKRVSLGAHPAQLNPAHVSPPPPSSVLSPFLPNSWRAPNLRDLRALVLGAIALRKACSDSDTSSSAIDTSFTASASAEPRSLSGRAIRQLRPLFEGGIPMAARRLQVIFRSGAADSEQAKEERRSREEQEGREGRGETQGVETIYPARWNDLVYNYGGNLNPSAPAGVISTHRRPSIGAASNPQANAVNTATVCAPGAPTRTQSALELYAKYPLFLGLDLEVTVDKVGDQATSDPWAVLQLAISSINSAALKYVKLLLAHPRIDVNALDMESRWSPLHRALYMGNLAACILLLQKGDSDTSLKDYEGYTAFDLYNSTVEGTKPEASDPMDLFTWGTNRNAALGLGDGADRAYPEQVFIPPQTEHPAPRTQPLSKRFQPIRVLDVSMAKLHTAAVTAEPCANLRVCGFGGVVRGAAQHRLAPLKDLALVSNSDDTHIVQVALGQDHTLALTRAGSVLSWGLSRFSQLGYAVDGFGAGLGTGALQMVATPRRVVGPLKKELIIGVAACKTASACWTAKDLFTWGTNNAQLGYDMAAVPVQVAQPVRNVALSDAAMAVLLTSNDVLCFAGGRSFKINFPTASFPPALTAYRPPAAQNNAAIAKVVCCENAFAALSSNGEMFALRFPAVGSSSVIEANATQSKESKGGISAVSNAAIEQFSAVKDVALGSDGTIVPCTESGPVYGRNRLAKTAKAQHMPFL